MDAWDRMRRRPADALLGAADLPGGATLELLDAVRADVAGAGVPSSRSTPTPWSGGSNCWSEAPMSAIRPASPSMNCAARSVRSSNATRPLRSTRSSPCRAARTIGSRVAAATPNSPSRSGGDLVDCPLSWLLQVLHFDSRTAAIVVRSGELRGTVYVENGTPVHATPSRPTTSTGSSARAGQANERRTRSTARVAPRPPARAAWQPPARVVPQVVSSAGSPCSI